MWTAAFAVVGEVMGVLAAWAATFVVLCEERHSGEGFIAGFTGIFLDVGMGLHVSAKV